MDNTKTRTNELGFRLISQSLRQQLFPNKPEPQLTSSASQRVADHYKQFGVALPIEMPAVAEHDWKLPKLLGSDLTEHFDKIGKLFAEPYDKRARKLIEQGIPAMPKASSVLLQPGWVMYKLGQQPVAVDCPQENCFVLDCETYVLRGAFPVIAVAVSTEAWYIWLDPALVDLSLEYEPNLYDIGDDKLLLGHNATYDFQRSTESHWLDLPAGKKRNYFLCTMAMNIVCNGYSGPQRWVATAKDVPSYAAKWASAGCANSLVACYNFHCWPEVPLDSSDKELREMFVSCHLPEIRANFTELIQYAMLDVQYTYELFAALYPVFRQKRSSWISLAGVLQQSAHNLPVIDRWHDWIQDCEDKLAEYELAIDTAGRDIANGVYDRFAAVLSEWSKQSGLDGKPLWLEHNKLLAQLPSPEFPSWAQSMSDQWLELMLCPWLGAKQIDWQIRPGVKSMRGQPEWRRSFSEYTKASRQLHQFMKIATEEGYPVFWAGSKNKWCYYNAAGVLCHVYKPGTEVSGQGLLNKDHAQLFEQGKLKVTADGGDKVLKLAMAVTYWVSCRSRVKDEIVSRQQYKSKDGSEGTVNVISPSLVPTGTVSGRGVSPLWLTVTDCKPYNNYKIGVELKSRVQAPPGKVLMSADMSAQELRIGAVYADSIAARPVYDSTEQLGYIGSSLMSHGVYAGNKELGTDPHTLLAKSVGVSRDGAKTAGYALLYGAGIKTIAGALMWDYNALDIPKAAKDAMARKAAADIISYKRGKSTRNSPVFSGGTDSATYTVLGLLASKPYPRTPLLGNMLTAPLCPANCGNDFVTGRGNWGIQATARDQGDCLAVAYQYLCEQHGVDSRVIFLLHDEYITVTDEQDVSVAAWLFNVAHCWTWAYTNEAMAIYDMAAVGVWFDDVLIQKCLRKAANLKTNTPSNTVETEDMPDGTVLLEWDLPKLNDQAVARGLQTCPELYV